MTQLDDIFARRKSVAAPERICRRVLGSASADFAALWPPLLVRAEAEPTQIALDFLNSTPPMVADVFRLNGAQMAEGWHQ